MTEQTAWADRYAGSLMNTFGPPQRVLVRGEGAYVWDADGNRYLDLLAGIAVNALGHAHPALRKAVDEQMATLGHVSNFFATPPQVELAERLLGLVGQPGKVFFTSSGTEANEAAFKLTRRTGRTRVVAATGAFHGRTMGALALTHKEAYRTPFEPLPGDVAFVEYGDADALAAAVDETVAAIVLEPVQGEAGAIVPPAGYLAAARRIADEHGALLWFDEVQSGIGRTGAWFAYTASGVQPDVLTVAKGLGGGIPIGACLAFGAAADLLQPGNHGTTFGGNPVSTAAALAVLDTIEADGLLVNATTVGDRVRERAAALPLVADVSGAGLLIGIGLSAPVANEVRDRLLARGIVLNAATPQRLRLVPPLILTAEQADEAVDALAQVLAELAAESEVVGEVAAPADRSGGED
ncbi:acetylornithine aminotransferase [Mumia flava]|uniref:Acetylornithine aminotransferase n=1 Tax=Mumia flava TaxID=1348852 RepID=A0A2M9BD09_9ACTN|nr:acetylornithine transaminase [Mumia flava]PJJ55812.1 acetylornithine aminotransferase [Mumia flava]